MTLSSSFKPPVELSDFIYHCAPNEQVMICGLSSCDYGSLIFWLRDLKDAGKFKDIFSFSLAYQLIPTTTFENRIISKINFNDQFDMAQVCKSALVNIVAENLKRKKIGLPIIPLVFVIGKDEIQLDIQRIFEKGDKKNKVTDAEIKRAYKLCFDSSLDEDIRTTAKETFQFITLISNEPIDGPTYSFIKELSPWDLPEWKYHWDKRVKTPKTDPGKTVFWRNEIKRIQSF